MELGKMYVDEFRSNIADPLRQEVLELRDEIDQLRNAIQRIADCPHSGTCPVRLQLLNESHIDA
jgi:ribosomal protein RSM22 (predicted rRNA methylase)